MNPSRLFSFRSWIVLPVLILLTMSSSVAQIFKVNQPEIKKYPKVSAFFTAQEQVGPDFVDINPLDSTDFDLYENGVLIPTVNVSKRCSTMIDGPSVCVVLVIDKSGSMGEVVDQQTGSTRFDFVKQAAQVFVNAVNFVGNSRVAVVSFDGEAYLEQEFSNNRTLLNTKINDIILGSATKYDPPMLDPRWGAIQLLKDGNCVAPTKRVVIFLTDGFPKPDPTDTLVQKGLDANGIIFYAITAFNAMNPYLQKWADKTGGKAFEANGQDAKSRLVEIYKQIASELQSKQTCYLEWISPMSCDEGGRQRKVEVKLKKTFNITSSTNYVAPASSVLKIDVSDPVVFFGDPDPGAGDPPVKKTVTVTAKNGRIVLTSGSISTSGGAYQLLPPNNTFPITIDSGKSVTFEIEFTQSLPKSFRQGTLVLKGIPCDPPIISLVAGLSNVVLLSPGEVSTDTSTSCEDILIRWAGIKPDQPVLIQYKDINGAWQLISDSATGLSYVWPASQIAKLPIGTTYKIKIQIPPTKSYVWLKQVGGVLEDSLTSIALSSDGLYSYISGSYEGTGASFGGTTLNSVGGSMDGFVAQLDGSGAVVWASSFGGSSDDMATGVAAGPNNVSYVTGYFKGDAFFGGQQKFPFNKAAKNYFMARVSSSGQMPTVYSETQSKSGITGESYGTEIAYDPSTGFVYVHGMFKGRIKDNDPKFLQLVSTNPNVYEPFTAVHKEDGTLLSIERGKNENQRPYTKLTATDKDGCLYRAENFENILADKTPLAPITSTGKKDGAISKFCGVPASIDSSAFPFVIAKPKLVSVDTTKIVFRFTKKASVGVPLDEIISAGICNYGTKSTEILDVLFSNPEFEMSNSIIGRNFYVPNCDTVGLEIRFTPTHPGDTCTEMLIISACSDPLKLIICAEAVEPCTFTKKDVDMDSVLVGGSRDSVVTAIFCNTSAVQIKGKLTLEGANPEDFEIIKIDPIYPTSIPKLTDTIITVNPNVCLTITIRFKPSAAGNRTAVLKYNLPDGCEVAQSLLNGKGLAPLAIDVPAINWTCTRPGTKSTQTISITNIGTSVATVNSITVTPVPFSLQPAVPAFTLGAGEKKDVVVEFAPVTVGTFTGTLTVNATAASGTKDFTSALTGESCVPVVSLSKNCFDPTAIGSALNKSDAIVVTNTGNFLLNVTSITVISGDITAFNTTAFQPFTFSIPPGDSQKIAATFTPGIVGNLKAKVEIVSDGIPGRDTVEVCGIAFSPDTTIDFGTILLCDRPKTDPMFYPNLTGGDIDILVSSDNANFEVSPKGLIKIPFDGNKVPFTVEFAPTTVGTHFGTVTMGQRNVQVKGTARVTPIDFFAVPLEKDSLKIHPGDITKVTVKADIGASLLTTVLDTMTFTFKYDDQLFTVAKTGGVPNISPLLAGWNWNASLSFGTLIVSGKGPAIVGPATGQSLFAVDFVGYLADKLIYSLAMTSNIPSNLVTCLPTTSKGTVFVLDDKICFVAGRLINTGTTTYQLHQAKPTPAVNEAKFEYGIGLDGNAEIELMNAMGEKVMTLVNQHHTSGLYEISLDVSRLPAGVYFYVLRAGPYMEQQKLIITK
ncbi:MAG: choice-of-anchor D domain-containing protein [Ignavibacteria bacterium]|nr:choice-of-anchor D domain-containing protein [Ignavibacteria bacterium]